MEESNYQTETREDMKEVVGNLLDLLNHTGANADLQAKLFCECLSNEHRTLQQSFWRMMHHVILLYVDNLYDARNESSVQFCQFISKAVRDFDQGFPMI